MLSRRVKLDMGPFQVYPNLYIILVAGSGRCRKSSAIGVIEKLLRETEKPQRPNIIAQRITPEALIDALRHTVVDGVKQKAEQLCDGFVVADELATFLNKKSYEAGLAPLLIKFWDCAEEFEYRTMGRGSEIARNTCLGMLAGSTIDWLKNAVPEEAVGSGLTSRFLFIYVDRPTKPIARTSFSPEKERLSQELIKELEGLAKLKGEARLTEDAWDVYEELYIQFFENSPMFEDAKLSGYASRRNVYLLKLALIFACQEHTLDILPRHIIGAQAMLQKVEIGFPKVLTLLTSSERGSSVEFVYERIAQMGSQGIYRAHLMRLSSHKMNSRELDDILRTLMTTGRVYKVVKGPATLYRARF